MCLFYYIQIILRITIIIEAHYKDIETECTNTFLFSLPLPRWNCWGSIGAIQGPVSVQKAREHC